MWKAIVVGLQMIAMVWRYRIQCWIGVRKVEDPAD